MPVKPGTLEYLEASSEHPDGDNLFPGGTDMSADAGEAATFATTGWKRILPALTLVVMAPLVAEVLPGATRFSSLFVLPIEMCVWGGGALMIRYAVRRWRLGWAQHAVPWPLRWRSRRNA